LPPNNGFLPFLFFLLEPAHSAYLSTLVKVLDLVEKGRREGPETGE
jgi:hypothetical protein